MEDVLSYTSYSEVICIHISCDGDVRTFRSLNKFISVEPISHHSGEKIRACSYLPDGFGPHPKYKGENEDIPASRQIPASVISFFNEIKQDLKATLGQNFAESQFLVIAPIEWRNFNYKAGMRLIFKRARWLLDSDHSNRMIITNFLKGFVYYLQSAASAPKFERDRRYIHCNIDRRSSEIYVSLTHYHIFNLKGLRRVSMKLATDDTLLTPSILNYQQINIPNIDDIIKPPIYNLIAQRIPLSIMERGSPISREFSNYEGLIDHIANDVMNVLTLISKNESLLILQLLPTSYKEDDQLQAILGLIVCEDVMDAIYDDLNFNLETEKICESIVKTVAMFTKQTTAEDRIRDVFLYLSQVNDDAITFFQSTIQGFLFYQDFFGSSPNIFKGTHTNFGEEVSKGAMMVPYTMVQIANTLLPPQITTRDNSSYHADSRLVAEILKKANQCKNTDPLTPNSFYVQAYIHDNCVRFILNKVIEVLANEGMQKSAFTATRERSIELVNMLDLACESVWNHLQTVDEQLIVCPQRNCTRQGSSVASLEWNNYTAFKTNFKAVFGRKKANVGQALDTSIPISISDSCKCSVVVTLRLLQDIGLKSAIQAFGAVVASSVCSDSLFGLYNVSALIVIDDFWKQKDLKLFNSTFVTTLLSKQVHASLQAHSKRPTVIFGIDKLRTCNYLESWGKYLGHIFDKSIYCQVSSTGYMLELFSPDASGSNPHFEVYQVYPTVYQKIKSSKRELHYIDITVSKRGDLLDDGSGCVTKQIMFQDGKSYSIGVFAADVIGGPTLSGGVAKKYLHTFPCPKNMNRTYPLILKIYSQHYSANIKIEMVWIANKFIRGKGLSDSGYAQMECQQSFTVHERLTLKHT